VYDTGKLNWTAPQKKSGFRLNEYYENVLTEYISAGTFSPKGTSDATWICRKYFAWLILEGHNDLNGVGADQIQRFMIYCSHHQKGSGLHNVKLYMKKLYAYFAGNDYTTDDYSGLFAFPVSRASRLFPALPAKEIAAMIEIIDRRTAKGKRDYAIILLGVVMGLRAIDIARMRLSDIDWRKGEIRIVQEKTGKSLALPLTKDVGEAIQAYILQGRQNTTSEMLFLSCHAPFRGFSNGTAIGDMYDYYRQRSGLPRDAYDGKGFHALRRTRGTTLVTSGISVNMVAQVLGDENIDSTKKYIALDSHHLKECAIDFTGIAPKGGAYYE
jgi:integrase